MRSALLFGAVAALVRSSSAILAVQGSPCDVQCGNVLSSTSGADVVCQQSNYGTLAGTVFQSCTTCQLASTYYSPSNETDLSTMLYNLRYAVSTCVFGYGGSFGFDNPCLTSTACGPLQDAFEFGNLSASAQIEEPYGYCRQNWSDFQVPKCEACLWGGGNQYLSNFVTMLDAACQQEPALGSTIAVEGAPFSTTLMNVTTPTPTAKFTYPGQNKVISLGAKVGITLGGIVVLLAIAGCCIVMIGKRRRRSFLKQLKEKHGHQGWPTPKSGTDMFETPISQRPLNGWNDSPVSAHTDPAFPRYFSPYSSQFNSPTSAVDNKPMQWPQAWPSPLEQHQEYLSPLHASPQERHIGVALGGEDRSLRSKPSNQSITQQQQEQSPYGYGDGKGKEREEIYELREVDSGSKGSKGSLPMAEAPVLQHPGYDRKSREGQDEGEHRQIA